jgi:protein O-GlcNAc transferase
MASAERTPHAAELDLAVEQHRQGRWAEAESFYQSILAREPDCAEALHLLGMLRHDAGRVDEGIAIIRRSIEIDGGQPHVLSNYGSLLAKAGKLDDALAPLSEAVRIAPAFAPGHNNLGAALERLGRWAEALAAFDRAIAIEPEYADAHTHRGNVLRWFGHIDAAIAAYEMALRIRPNHAVAMSGLGAAYGEAGDVEGIIRCQRAVLELWAAPHPSAATAHSDLLYTLHYDPELTPEQLFSEHLAWAKMHAEHLYPDPLSGSDFVNDLKGDRRLRIGYVSADFRKHPIAIFLLGALEHADRQRFETYCYSDVRRPDEITHRCEAAVDHWRIIANLNDAQLTQLIRQDQIDVLVDQTGHAGGNRMLVFARRAAPVQMTFNGYIDTTGLHTMDYRLTDACHDPPGSSERFYTERLARLSGGLWCYSPEEHAQPLPAVRPPPMLTKGHVTFGCLNKPVKMNRNVLNLWVRLLHQMPSARLLIGVAGGEDMNHGVRRRFEAAGIPGQRLDIVAKTRTRLEYLERYHDIDVALDTFPFNGMTTTCDALLMGVPVVVLAGNSHVSRSGVSFLNMAGLPQLVAENANQYVRIAADLANDIRRLQSMRATQRARLFESKLCDKEGFARRLEDAYRLMWRGWCGSREFKQG